MTQQELLERHLVPAKDVKLLKRIGAGAFGEVFQGTARGASVAVKTMLQVSEKSALAFRAEILMTAELRHPNIVSFQGACE